MNQIKKDIVRRMGGPSQYSMTIFEWSMLLVNNPALENIYRNVNFEQLCEIQRDVLDLALGETNNATKESMVHRVMMCHYNFFEMGWTSDHFDFVKENLRDALLHSWVETELIHIILERFEALRFDFFGSENCSHLMNIFNHEKEIFTARMAVIGSFQGSL